MFSGVTGILNRGHKIKGTVVLMRKNVLDINSLTSVGGVIGQGFDILGSTLDNLTAFLGRSVSLQLISATKPDGTFFISFSYYFHSLITNFLEK
jgi:linoleate 9S-lipoxygenase